VQQGRQTHCAKLTKSDSPKMTFFVSAKHRAQYFLCQPTVQEPKLTLIAYMLKIVVEDGDIANALFNRFRGNGGQELGARVGRPAYSIAFACDERRNEIDFRFCALCRARVQHLRRFGTAIPGGESRRR